MKFSVAISVEIDHKFGQVSSVVRIAVYARGHL